MTRILMALLAMLMVPVLTAPAAAQDAGAAKAAIEAAMLDSAAGWDSGNLERFLAIYSDDPATSFTGGDGVARGKLGIRARYRVSYAEQFGESAAARPMALSFTFEDFRLLAPDTALLIARWQLVTYGDEKGAKTGMTSLVFRKEADGWKIIADHSS